MDGKEINKKLHIAMYPWFAFGHMTPFLHLANKLAKIGHKVSFFLPSKAQLQLASHNHHQDLITFIPIILPPVDGLPFGAETTADCPTSQAPLYVAMDLTVPIIESYLKPGSRTISPIDVVFFDYANWLPRLGGKYGVKSIYYVTCYASHFAYLDSRARGGLLGVAPELSKADLMHPPPGFPSSSVRLREFEASGLETVGYSARCYFRQRVCKGVEESDAICFKSCKEMEGEFGEFLEGLYKKPVLWAGPVVPDPPAMDSMFDQSLESWLNGFEPRSVVYCCLGSESVLEKDQFKELVLGLELTGLPFLAVLKLPKAYASMELALSQEFVERTRGKGLICCEWVNQQLILNHPSIGCFVTHCGAGSLSEALVTNCQLVLLPQRGDQFINARLMDGHLKVGLEIERREEDGVFTEGDVCKAIMKVMKTENEVGKEIRANHEKWRDFLKKDGVEESYICNLVENLQALLARF